MEEQIIVEHVVREYLTTAKRSGQKLVQIKVKQLKRDLGLQKSITNVPRILKSRKFRELSGVSPSTILGSPDSDQAIIVFELPLEPKSAPPKKIIDTQAFEIE